VTDISGRGVGMDVVKTNIEAMSGEILITTEAGAGTRFKVVVPPTFSIIDGTVVMAGEQRYVIPLTEVLESVRVTDDSLQHSSTVGPVFLLRGEKYPAFFLEELLEMDGDGIRHHHQIALLMRSYNNTFAVLVDEIIGRQSVVIKNLGLELSDYKEFSGSTILGDGKPALIVELASLVKRAAHKKSGKSAKISKERMSA
jgi:two-component system chemotaxis sensor kinase CheA